MGILNDISTSRPSQSIQVQMQRPQKHSYTNISEYTNTHRRPEAKTDVHTHTRTVDHKACPTVNTIITLNCLDEYFIMCTFLV